MSLDRRTFLSGAAALCAASSLSAFAQNETLRVDAARLQRTLEELSVFGRPAGGAFADGVSRVAYSDADVAGRKYVMGLMEGMGPRVDTAGNIHVLRAGTDASLPPILFGSHIDSVPSGGNFDGDVGSLSALEILRTLVDKSLKTRHPLHLAIWQNEEGGLVGSTIAAGEFPAANLQHVSSSGLTIEAGIRKIGGDPTRLAEARIPKDSFRCYLELHIEQGGTLERDHVDAGVVEGIVGIKQWEVIVTGFANHAGTTPMDQRHDALLAASRFVEAVNRIVTSVPGRQVGTVGRIQAFPGAPNVIPGEVVCTLELRDLDAAKVDTLHDRIAAEANRIGAESGTSFAFRILHENVPAPTDPRVRALITDAARELGLTTKVMPSGAGHDAQAMAQLGPIGMIFIPSIGGISHAPKEFSRPNDIVNGANMLLGALLKMDEASWT